MPEIRPLRSTLLTAHKSLAQISDHLLSTIHGNEIALSVLSKSLGVVLFIAICSVIGVWQFRFRTSRLHELQLLVSTNYVALTIINNIVRLPSKSDILYSIRIYSISLCTIVQTYHLFGHWRNHRSFFNSVLLYHIGFAIQCCLLPGCWELLKISFEETNEKSLFLLLTFLFFVSVLWMSFGFVAPDLALQARKEQPSEEDKLFYERRYVIANIYTLSFDIILLICIQYA